MVKELEHAVREAFRMEPEAEALYVIASGDCFVNEQPAKFAANQLPEGKREVVKVLRAELNTPPNDAKPKAGKDASRSSGVADGGDEKTSDDRTAKVPPTVTPGDGEGAVRSEAELGGGAGGAEEEVVAPTSAALHGKPAPKKAAAKKVATKKK